MLKIIGRQQEVKRKKKEWISQVLKNGAELLRKPGSWKHSDPSLLEVRGEIFKIINPFQHLNHEIKNN
ncbi:hypothetical protein C1645_838345 [Glomus cerebriforme]|uniref:Uncharacterized protein n=1 Tax=Glomus cerebriforme TaxID=658196 RepID=A0A397S799_9GLOM|nr:hypothetical protein C1645_838345 [Glomus cerebriforme]